MEFKTLYQRNSNGSVQTWKIFVEGNAFWTETGKLGGKIVTSEKTVVAGKNIGKSNETTPEEQALSEVQAKYKKKLESGYSETVEGIDSTGLLEPMLAKEWKNYSSKVKWPVISSPKLDGIRVNATKDGLFSRNGKAFVSIPHIQKALDWIYDKYPEYVFDGELYNPQFKDDFDKIVSLVRKSKPNQEDLRESEQFVQFWIFDAFRKDGNETLTAMGRKTLTAQVVQELEFFWENTNPCPIKALDFSVIQNAEELDAKYAEYLEAGTEGQMINAYDALYQHKRTQDLLKRKEFQDAEFVIVDIVSGVGNREGCGKLICKIGDDTFDCAVKGTLEYMQELLKNKHLYIGKTATVKFQNWTPKQKPRFPVCTAIAREDYE